jgi:hypothetical protein
LSED